MIKAAYKSGIIKECPEVKDRLDFTTAFEKESSSTNPGYQDKPNYRFARGFPKALYENFIGYNNSVEGTFAYSVTQTVPGRGKSDEMYEYFLNYIRLAMYYSRDEVIAKYPPAKYPLILQNYDDLVSYFQSVYGIDLKGINSGPKK